jgi:manganese/zinc/iron transport system substrate-binding protein
MGIQGLSTESEAGLRRIEELVSLLVERTVGAVFVETSVSDANIRALIEGAGARGQRVASEESCSPTRSGLPVRTRAPGRACSTTT